MGGTRWLLLLVWLVGCGTPGGPVRLSLEPWALLLEATPCPADTQPRAYARERDTLLRCETPEGVVEGWAAHFRSGAERAAFAEYAAGRRHGVTTEWYPGGRVSSIVEYRHGVPHGRRVDYYASGGVMSEAEFRGGVQHGELTAYYRDGTPQVIGTFRAGRPDGIWYYYDASGALDSVVEFVDGDEYPVIRYSGQG